MSASAESWKMTLPCTRAEAEAVASYNELEDGLPVLLAREPDPAEPERWMLEAYLDSEPDAASTALLCRLAPSAAGQAPNIEYIPPADWAIVSQAGLAPVEAGRFFIHTAAHAHAVPPHAIAFQIEASRAFGTGQHETTTGCLLMLDQLRRQGARFSNIGDIGTGTGLLAFAAHKLWPLAAVIASDIDPVAIDVAAENAALNAIPIGSRAGSTELVVSAGLMHRRLRRRIPYDLIVANILAAPLIDLAQVFGTALAPGGTLILAGLLDHQADAVAVAYRRQGFRLAGQLSRGEWPTLRLVKRKRIGFRRSG